MAVGAARWGAEPWARTELFYGGQFGGGGGKSAAAPIRKLDI